MQLFEVHWLERLQALPRAFPEHWPFVQLFEAHWLEREQAAPVLVPRQHPSVQLFDSHWLLSEHREPVDRSRQYPPVQLFEEHWLDSEQALPRRSLHALPALHVPSRPMSRVHAEGSGRLEAARWLHCAGHMKSIGLHAAMHLPTSKPLHCSNAALVAQA